MTQAWPSFPYRRALSLDDESPTTFEALRTARPDLEPVPLDAFGPVDASYGAVLPQDLNIAESRLLVVGRNDRVRIRPVAIGGRSDPAGAFMAVRDAEIPRLREAMNLSDFDSRTQAIAGAMDVMLAHEDLERDEEEWSFLTDALLCTEDLPATALDLLKVLVTKPKFLVRCLFRLDGAPRKLLWRLEEDLPFSWLLIRRNDWWNEAKQAFERLREQLSGVFDGGHDQIARDHVISILDEGADRISALNTVSTDIAFRLEGGRLSNPVVDAARQERDRQLPEQIHLRASLDDWPTGDGRREWREELEQGELLDKLGMWQDPSEHPKRQPLFDTPIAAAWCCFLSKPTARTTFLTKRIRAHDCEWFDLAYSAAWFRLAAHGGRHPGAPVTETVSISNLIQDLTTRSGRAILSQLGLRSATLRKYLGSLYGREPGAPGALLADPVLEAVFGWKLADVDMQGLSRGGLLREELVSAMDKPPREGTRASTHFPAAASRFNISSTAGGFCSMTSPDRCWLQAARAPERPSASWCRSSRTWPASAPEPAR